MRKDRMMLVLLLTIIITGCLQSQPFTSHTSTTSQQSSSNTIVASPTSTTIPIRMVPEEQIEDFKLTVDWKESANVLILYLEVQNQTACTKIDGKLKVTIRDEFGFPIYNGTLTIHKSDFQPYTEKFTGVSENLTKITMYKARYIITDFQKGVSSSGIVNATLIAGNTTLKRTFIATDLPKMNEKERKEYFENLYLKNAKPLNITQIDGNVELEFYRYGIYIHYVNLRKYLRIDAKLRNIGNYSIEVIGREPAKLTVDGFPVEEYHSEFWYGYPKKLEPGEYIKEIFLFPMDEISLNSEEFVFKVQETEIIPERKVATKLSGLRPLLEYKNANISKVAQKFPIEITLVKYAVFEYETFEGKERGIKVVLRIKNTGNKEITVDLNEISLGGNVKIAPSNWFLTVSPNSEKEVWLLFPYVEGETELTIHLYDLIEYKDEFLEIPVEIGATPKPNEIEINKTIEAYPLVITLGKVEKIPYLEINKLKPLVKLYVKLKNIGENNLLLNIDQWKLITSEGIIRHGDIVISNITGAMELSPGSYVSGYVAFSDVPDDVQYTLEITIPPCQRILSFKDKLLVRP